ncbi:MAG: chemotaxis protein CheX [Oscillospiraceae bacterium]
MFTQFFGNYLLSSGLVTGEQLAEALFPKTPRRLKLGTIAINEGLVTAEQVETAHMKQQQEDKRIGDVMVELGYLTSEQVEQLFSMQHPAHLLLGQSLIDNGVMTNAEFEKALGDYKREYSISEDDIRSENEMSVRRIMADFYSLSDDSAASKYVYLLFKNIIRFIGDDFMPVAKGTITADATGCIKQDINGGKKMLTAIHADDTAAAGFASRFAKEQLTENDEYTQACLGEFLNLHNGLFAVNVSNDEGSELKLTPQEYGATVPLAQIGSSVVITLRFSFGMIDFFIDI